MNGPTHMPVPPRSAGLLLDRAAVAARRATVHAELLAAMQTVERYKGALAVLDELLTLDEPEGAA